MIRNPLWQSLLVVLILLPVLYIGVPHTHDWGDDFAQYIHQALNLVRGIPMAETGFIYSSQNFIGPPAYPAGFPLLLAPVAAVVGNDIYAFILLIACMYFVFGWLVFRFYHQQWNFFVALFLTLILIYNPLLLQFRREVMSDIPFAVLVLSVLILVRGKQGQKAGFILLITLLLCFSVIFRVAGFALVTALILEQSFQLIQGKITWKEFSQKTVAWAVVPLFIYVLVNTIVFPLPAGGGMGSYIAYFQKKGLFATLGNNIYHYLRVYHYMFDQGSGGFWLLSQAFSLIMVLATAFGFVMRLKRGLGIIEWYYLIYIGMLMLFPNPNSAFRLMVPVSFISLMYAAVGIGWAISFLPKGLNKEIWLMPALLIVSLLYLNPIRALHRSRLLPLDGPQQPEAIQAFDFIKTHLPKGAILSFNKPRALALYTNHTAMCDPFTPDTAAITHELEQAGAGYLLTCEGLTRTNVVNYIQQHPSCCTEQWSKGHFRLYRFNRATSR